MINRVTWGRGDIMVWNMRGYSHNFLALSLINLKRFFPLLPLTINNLSVWALIKKESGDSYKARLVAKGYTQTYEVDYHETFALVTKMNTIRVLLSLAVN